MENSGYNLRQRPFLVSTTADSLATITTSSVSTFTSSTMSYPASSSSGSGLTVAPTVASLRQETLGSDSARGIGVAAEPMDPAASSGELLVQSNTVTVDFSVLLPIVLL